MVLLLAGMTVFHSCGKSNAYGDPMLIGTWLCTDDDYTVYYFTEDSYATGTEFTFICDGAYSYTRPTKMLRLYADGIWYESEVEELTNNSLILNAEDEGTYHFQKIATPNLNGNWKMSGGQADINTQNSIDGITISGQILTVKYVNGSSKSFKFLFFGVHQAPDGYDYQVIGLNGAPFGQDKTFYLSISGSSLTFNFPDMAHNLVFTK